VKGAVVQQQQQHSKAHGGTVRSVGDILIGTGQALQVGRSWGAKADVVVINPDTDLDLTLRSSLALR